MGKFTRTRLSWALAGLFCWQVPALAVTVQGTSFGAGPVTPTTPLVIDLDQFPAAEQGTLSVFIGTQDVGGMIRATGERQITYVSTEYPLQPGASEVIVYLIKDPQQWQEVARLPLVVQPDGPVATSAKGWTFAPKLDVIGPVSRKEDTKRGQVESSATTTDAVGTLQGGVQVERKEDDWDIKAGANFAGSSQRSQALQFGQKGSAAEKIDLAQYLVEGGFRDTRFALGQITVSGNPLIASSLANRGLVVTRRVNERIDVAVSAQNGTSIVGFDRFFGIYDTRNNFTAATVGFEAFPERARALRVELSYLDAAIKPAHGVNASSTISTEESQGIGVRVLGSTPDNRLVGDFAYGISRYESKPDEFVPANPAHTRNAYVADVGYTIVQSAEMAPNWPVTVAAKARREYAQALFKSLGSGFAADFAQDLLALNSNIGSAQASLQYTRREDNVQHLSTLPQNHVENLGLNLNLPIAQMIAVPAVPTGATAPPAPPSPWWPSLTLGAQRVHQYANNAPTDFPTTSLADIMTTTLSAGVTWTIDRWNAGVTVNRNLQDNRQVGAENQDIRTVTFNANLAWRALDNLTFTASYGPSRTLIYAQDLTRNTYNPQVGFSWTFEPGWSISGNYNFDRTTDSLDLNDTRGYGFNTSISKSFEITTPWGYAQRGQVALRHFVNNNTSRNVLGDQAFENRVRTNGIVLTLSLNFF